MLYDAYGKKIVPVNRSPRVQRRSYHAGVTDRLTTDWIPSTMTPDRAISTHIQTLRDRARQLEKDNRYIVRWLSSLENNVLGAEGINLQMKVRFSTGRFDKGANDKIESAWAKWGKPENCSVNREDSWVEMQRLILRSTARDGGILIRIVRGPDLNSFGFALDLLEIDLLDVRYIEMLPNGHEVRLGVERNRAGQVVAYHLLQSHPGDFLGYPMPMNNRDRIRVPAYGTNPTGDEILHYYVKDRVMQSLGVPWLVAAMSKLHHLDQYEEAELLQSRAASEKGGWFENSQGEQWGGDDEQSTDSAGILQEQQHLMDFEKCAYEQLPPGFKFIPYDPTHPNPPYDPYVRTVLHGAAAGLNIDYATLTGDLSQNSFSSTKAGRLEIQEQWQKTQGHMIGNVCEPVFGSWLPMAILSGEVRLPMSKLDALNKPKFRGRTWPWVDPVKDMQAAQAALDAKVRTRTDIIAENGGDFEDVVDQLKYEKEMMDEAGLNDVEKKPKSPNGQEQIPEDPDDNESDNDGDDDQEEDVAKPPEK